MRGKNSNITFVLATFISFGMFNVSLNILITLYKLKDNMYEFYDVFILNQPCIQ
jgi:hypothetical protein